MWDPKRRVGLSSANLVILVAALVKFLLHLYNAPGYGYFGDELYTIDLSRHLAFGYVDLPPLVPALVALSRALLGESLFAVRIFPALAGSATLVFVCLITRMFGGKTFAVAVSALGFIIVPTWLSYNSAFCYDSIDQLVLAVFLYVLVRFLRTGNHKLWLLLGLIAGIACLTKMTILFMGPGFLIALLVSKHRRSLLTPWPWLGAVVCGVIVSPYLIWQNVNHWPTLEYWIGYGTIRVYQASLPQYLSNVAIYTHWLLLPFWLVGLYRIFRRLDGVNYGFLGLLFVGTLTLLFFLHGTSRLLVALFMPLLAAGAVCVEEFSAGGFRGKLVRGCVTVYLLAAGSFSVLTSLPLVPPDRLQAFVDQYGSLRLMLAVREFNGLTFYPPQIVFARVGWEELIQDVADVYGGLPAEDRAVAGIYTDWYMSAGAIDQLGPAYGLPRAVSPALTYYLWGPGYSWDVMILVTRKTNNMSVFFGLCELKKTVPREYDALGGRPYIYVCRKPKVSPEVIWSSLKSYR